MEMEQSSIDALFSVAVSLCFPRCLLTPDAEDPAVLDDTVGDVFVLGPTHQRQAVEGHPGSEGHRAAADVTLSPRLREPGR